MITITLTSNRSPGYMNIPTTRGKTALYATKAPFTPYRYVPAITAHAQATRYASAQAIPVLDLRTRARKEEQAKVKRMEANKAQGRALVGFGIFATLATIAAQFLFANGSDRGDTN